MYPRISRAQLMEFLKSKLHLNLELKILEFIEFSQKKLEISPKISHVFLFSLSFDPVVGMVAVVMSNGHQNRRDHRLSSDLS